MLQFRRPRAVGEASTGEASTGEASTGEVSTVESSAGESSTGESSTVKSSAGESSTGEGLNPLPLGVERQSWSSGSLGIDKISKSAPLKVPE